jgi:phosphohistidine phosphatase
MAEGAKGGETVGEGVRFVTLIRHAKAAVESVGPRGDFDRPLAGRGERDAKTMGRRLADVGFAPDRIVSSAARRALRTARLIAGEIDYSPDDIVVTEDIYLSSPGTLLDILYSSPDEDRHLVLVGHNPGMSDLFDLLCGELMPSMPTCAVARLEVDAGSWTDVVPGSARLLKFDYPKSDRG